MVLARESSTAVAVVVAVLTFTRIVKSLVVVHAPVTLERNTQVKYCQGADTDTGHPLQVYLLGRFHVGHSLALDKLFN